MMTTLAPDPSLNATVPTEVMPTPPEGDGPPVPTVLLPAAVPVLLSDGTAGLQVTLTQRAPDLADYLEQWVFPGGVTDSSDAGPVATAVREAAEAVGLDPASVQVIGRLSSIALLDSGFLVTPVLAWSARAKFA